MSVLVWVLRGLLMWLGLALPVGVVLGRAIKLADQQRPTCDDLTALVPVESWSDTAVREEFDAMTPGFVTEDSFELDNEINRRARRGWVL